MIPLCVPIPSYEVHRPKSIIYLGSKESHLHLPYPRQPSPTSQFLIGPVEIINQTFQNPSDCKFQDKVGNSFEEAS